MKLSQTKQAARAIKTGKLIVFPTETVYGLGADAFNVLAIKKIFQAKNRPADNPLIVHIAEFSDLHKVSENIDPQALAIAKKFWPGPLTILFPKHHNLPQIVCGKVNTVAVRMPDNRIAKALIKLAQTPIAAPSANLSGSPSCTTIKSAKADLGNQVAVYLNNGRSKIGLESTVISVKKNKIIILRPGKITKAELQRAFPKLIIIDIKKSKATPPSPGMKYRHYAPKTKLMLVYGEKLKMIKKIKQLINTKKHVGVMCLDQNQNHYQTAKNVFNLGKDLDQIAHNIFAGLRLMDKKKLALIICEGVPETGIGIAIMNRLKKAATIYLKAR